MSSSPEPAPTGQQGPSETQALYNNIFGDDSDLSDDDDDFAPRPSKSVKTAEAGADEDDEDEAAAPREDRDETPPTEDDADAEEDADAYVPGTATTPAKIPKFKKSRKERPGAEDEDGEDAGDGDEERRKRKKKKLRKEKDRRERRAAAENTGDMGEEDETAIFDEATRESRVLASLRPERRMALEEKLDNIGRKAKVQRRKKKGEDVDIVDSYHDEICQRIRLRMGAAADKDRRSNEQKLPATAKLAMLDEVMNVLRNATLWQSILDNGVLEGVVEWLEPMEPSGALPAVGIQKAFFEVLPKMDLDTTTLKEARLGPIVLFYTKTKRVSPSINRAAEGLVQAWMAPLLKRGGHRDYRSAITSSALVVGGEENAGDGDGADEGDGTPSHDVKPRVVRKRFDIRQALKENEGRRGARMPVVPVGSAPFWKVGFANPQEIQYTVAPESRGTHDIEDKSHVERLAKENTKFNKFARQMKVKR